jgi:sterol desaturase/sphingolipid hydroxylase (fatty acid hydroxylase superfamily)
MSDKVKLYETIIFFSLYLVFTLFERHRFTRDRKNFKRDIISMICLFIFVAISREFYVYCSKLAPLNLPLPSSPWIRIPLIAVITDFCIYLIHLSMHKYRPLWKTHLWHHSQHEMNQLSGLRTSFTHTFIFAFPQIFIAVAIFQCSELEIIILLSYAVFVQLFQHADFSFKGEKWIEYLLVTPRYHKLHHSSGKAMNMNISNSFTLWDRLFGTYLDPDKVQIDSMGVKVADKNVIKSIAGV